MFVLSDRLYQRNFIITNKNNFLHIVLHLDNMVFMKIILFLIHLWRTLSWWNPGFYKTKITYCILSTEARGIYGWPHRPMGNADVPITVVSPAILYPYGYCERLLYHTLSPSHFTWPWTKRFAFNTKTVGTVWYLFCSAVCIKCREYVVGTNSHDSRICSFM